MEKVSFELFGLTLLEPLSSLMNWVLAALCIYFYFQLKNREDQYLKYWSWFFLMFGLSFFFGGISHLFYEYVGLKGKIPGWSCSVLAVAVGEMAMVLDVADEKKRRVFISLIRSMVFATFVMLFLDLSFTWVMVHTAGFWVFVGVLAVQRWRAGQTGYKYFLQGMSFLLVMAVVKIGEVDIDPAWFNRDDIAHFIMLGMYWMFYRGVEETAPSSQHAFR